MTPNHWLALEGHRVHFVLTSGKTLEGEVLSFLYDLREVGSAQEAKEQGQLPKICQVRLLGSKREKSLILADIQAYHLL